MAATTMLPVELAALRNAFGIESTASSRATAAVGRPAAASTGAVTRIAPWDVAAGALLISEAGGVLTDFDGGTRYLERGNVVAGPVGVAEDIRKAARGIVSEDTI